MVGTPFADYIVGTSAAEKIYGGGGGDVILGHGGADQVYGGAEGDYCESTSETTRERMRVHRQRKEGRSRETPSEAHAGVMAPQQGEPAALYLTGSDGNDESRRLVLQLTWRA